LAGREQLAAHALDDGRRWRCDRALGLRAPTTGSRWACGPRLPRSSRSHDDRCRPSPDTPPVRSRCPSRPQPSRRRIARSPRPLFSRIGTHLDAVTRWAPTRMPRLAGPARNDPDGLGLRSTANPR
jgi:hypothetical protein